jgi:hypothetical protein
MKQQFDGTVTEGRKGVAYDWQSVYVAAQMESLDAELDAFLAANR